MHRVLVLVIVSSLATVARAGDETPTPEPGVELVAPKDAKLATVKLACEAGTEQMRIDDATYCAKSAVKGSVPIKQGPAVWFHPNGAIASQGRFRDNKREGRWVSWDEQGHRVSLVTYAVGAYDGLYLTWWVNGKRQSEIVWKAGKKHGVAKSWGDDGKLLAITRYDQDKVVQKTAYGPDGKPQKP